MSIEEIAKSWLLDPSWIKVFKHTFDVLEDYVSYVLVSVGAIALSVRLLTTLGTGDLMCILIGVRHNNETLEDLGPYAGGGTIGMINYAQTDQRCIREVFTPFMEYLPYLMLLQTLILIVVEKFTFKIPRIAQKVERFYANIVEQSLFGKDPDVAEDMTDPKTSTEAISRRRQRNEICVSLKRSSIIYSVYIGKNFVKVFLDIFFLTVDINYTHEGTRSSAACVIEIEDFPGIVDGPGLVHFQCRGKKLDFFMIALYTHVVLLGLHLLLSLGAIVWCFGFRSVSKLLTTIENTRKEWEPSIVSKQDGSDFLFLFDLLAHSCGIESTLRVLTHSDDTFYEICRPNMASPQDLQLEEDKLKITWEPADIERWLHSGKHGARISSSIEIDSYEVTIFPAETVNNSQTVSATKFKNKPAYSVWFYDLIGGKTEYVITIACMIGKSRMKGEKVVTTLMPYGPEKPRSGMLKSSGTNQVEIFWDPPKGDFTKYTLMIEKITDDVKDKDQNKEIVTDNLPIVRLNSGRSRETLPDGSAYFDKSNLRHMENLSAKLTEYTILGLDPGDKYKVQLGTKTGTVSTRQYIYDTVITRPAQVSGLLARDIKNTSCIIQWFSLEGHPCLKGFQIQVKTHDGKEFKSVAVPKSAKTFNVYGMSPSSDYDVSITALCVYQDRRTQGDPTTIPVTTLADPVKNLRMENSTPNSIFVKWDAPTGVMNPQNAKYKITISAPELEFSQTVDLSGDKTQYNFSKLPDPEGSGHMFKIDVQASILTIREHEVTSDPSTLNCATLPHKPSGFKIGTRPFDIVFTKSPTPTVSSYKIKWKSIEEGSKPEETIIPTSQSEEQHFKLKGLTPNLVYKVNVYALVTLPNDVVLESKELHEKVILDEASKELKVFVDEM